LARAAAAFLFLILGHLSAASSGLHQSVAIDLVVISSTGKAPRIVDELRIGPTWRSVVPIHTSIAQSK
jgi:hypothetical protein